MIPQRNLRSAIVPAVAFAALLLAALPAAADLVGYWPLNEASWNGTTDEVADLSAEGNHGTARFDAHSVPGGRFDRAGAFDGSWDVVYVPTDSSLELGSDGTISAWANFTTLPSGTYQIFGGNAYQDSFLLRQALDDFTAYWQSGGPAKSVYDVFGVSTWHHVAISTTAGTMTTYVDGQQYSAVSVASMGSAALGYGIGGRPAGNWTVNGMVDDTAIWDEGLDEAHVQSIYTVPTDLGLDYDLGDVMALWDIHDMGPGGSGLVDGTFWTFTTNLPGSPNQGDAYEDDSLFYVALGDGTGVQTVPEPSTFILCVFGLLGLGFRCRWRKR